MVLACHTHGMFNVGEQGVDGFLVMSGWLNAMSMDRALRANKPAWTATKSFFIHRAFRILPAYYLLLILIFIFMGNNRREACLEEWQVFFLFDDYGKCWAVQWSLALEVQLYFTIPIITMAFHYNHKLGSFTLAGFIHFMVVCAITKPFRY